MPLRFTCSNPDCRKVYKLPDEFLGRRVRCRGCSTEMTVDGTTTVHDDEMKQPARPAASSAPLAAPPGENHLGRFVVKKQLGAGAFGAVFQAYDPQLDREVALKVPHAVVLESPKRVERFFREARAAAGLRHPNIVPVYDSGQADGKYFIASAFITGQPIEELIGEQGMEPRRAATIVRRIAEGLAYAHNQGVVHRDIKPANVLLAADDQPLIADFGLASRADEEARLTNDGAILGTPSYMAPEQAAGQQGEARPASDQYSLGVMLYEMLCGKTPFEGPAAIVLHNAIHTAPEPPSKHNKKIPRDLETICLRAMAKRPEDRYPDCQALADDLRRWLDGEPITARRLGFVERSIRWVKKEPALASALAILVAALGTIGVLLTVRNTELLRELQVVMDENKASRDQAEVERQAADLAREERDEEKLRGAAELARIGNVPGFEAAFAQVPEGRRGPDWILLGQQARRAPEFGRLFPSPAEADNGTLALAYSADSSTLVGLTGNGWLVAWDAWRATPRPLAQLAIRLPWAFQSRGLVSLSADLRRVVVALPRGRIDKRDGREVYVPDHIEVIILDAKTGKFLRSWKVPGMMPTVSLSPDGQILALAFAESDKPHRLGLWDTETGERRPGFDAELAPLPLTAVSMAFSPDCQTLAATVAQNSGEIALWSVPEGVEKQRIADVGLVSQLTFSADGQRLAAVGGNRFERVDKGLAPLVFSDMQEQRSRTVYRDHQKEFDGPDGQKRTVTEKIPTTETYTVQVTSPHPTVPQSVVQPVQVEVERLIEEQVMICEPFTVMREIVQTFTVKKRIKNKEGKEIEIDVPEYKKVQVPETATRTVTKPVFKTVKEIRPEKNQGLIRAWECGTGAESFRAEDVDMVHAIAWRPDGSRLVSATHGVLAQFQPCAADSEVSRCVRQGTVVRFWNSQTSKLMAALDRPGMQFVTCLSYSPDGIHLALGFSYPNQLLVWSAQSRALIAAASGHEGAIVDLAFSSDSKTLASYGLCSSNVRLWDGQTGAALRSVFAQPGQWLGFTPDHLLMTGRRRRADSLSLAEPPANNIRLWQRDTGTMLEWFGGNYGMTTLAATADGKRFLAQKGLFHDAPATPIAPMQMDMKDKPRGQLQTKGPSKAVIPSLPVVDGPTGKRLGELEKGQRDPFSTRWALTRDGKHAVCLEPMQQTASIWDVETGKFRFRREKLWSPNHQPLIPALSPESDRLALLSALPRPELVLVDLRSGQDIRRLEIAPDIREVAFAHKDRLLTFDHFQRMQLWDLEAGKPLTDFANPVKDRYAISPDGRRLAFVTGRQIDNDIFSDVQIHLIDLQSGKTLKRRYLPMRLVTDLTFSPDGKRLAYCGLGRLAPEGLPGMMVDSSAAPEGVVEILALEAGRAVARYIGHQGKVNRVVFRPDGKALASGGADRLVRLWHVPENDGEELTEPVPPPQAMPGPVTSPPILGPVPQGVPAPVPPRPGAVAPSTPIGRRDRTGEGVPLAGNPLGVLSSAVCCLLLQQAPREPALKLSDEEKQLLEWTNAERKKEGMAPLKASEKLFAAARGHCANMAKQDKLDHTLDGKTLVDRLQAEGYRFASAGENIAWNQTTPKEAIASWMQSEGHKANLLNKDYTEAGFALAKNARGERYWVQVFARPQE